MRALRLLIVAATLLSAANVSAALIRFDHTFSASGTIDGTSFSDALISITGFGDTDNRMEILGGFFIDHDTTSVTIEGVGEFDFVTTTRTFVSGSVVGFSRSGDSGADLTTGPGAVDFIDWDMLTDIGPVTGVSAIVQWDFSAVVTSGGVLELNDNGATKITFQAAVVPVPAALWLFVSGLLATRLVKRKA